jgi:hypothetical protein
MAKFQIGDWVKIIPTPDTKSDVWTNAHNKFCDKIGEVIDINDTFDDILVMRVSVHFDYKSSAYKGEHSVWFEDKHLVMSSKWESDRIFYLNDKFEEYRKFEKSYKTKRDKILKEAFTDPYEKERKKTIALKEAKKAIDEIKQIEEQNDMENWIMGDGWYVIDPEDF